MDTPIEIAKEEFFNKHFGECITCKYYSCRRVRHETYEFCEYHHEDIELVTECDDYRVN